MLCLYSLSAGATDRLAVMYFDTDGVGRDLDPLGRAIAQALRIDLQVADELEIVAWAELFDARRALDLPLSDAVDPRTARRVGERLEARWIITGALSATMEGIQIDSQLLDVSTGEVREATSASGPVEDFGRLQHAVSLEILAALGFATQHDWPSWSVERAVTVGGEIDEREAAYRGRLDSIDAYLDQRWVREKVKVDHIGLDDQVKTWALFDGLGNPITSEDAALKTGDSARLERMERHRRDGRAIAATSLTLGLAACAGTAVLSATTPSVEDLMPGTTAYKRRQRRRFSWFAGCGIGAVVAVNGVGIGTNIRKKPNHPGYYWTPDEADETIDAVNADLAEELRLTEADLEEANQTK